MGATGPIGFLSMINASNPPQFPEPGSAIGFEDLNVQIGTAVTQFSPYDFLINEDGIYEITYNLLLSYDAITEPTTFTYQLESGEGTISGGLGQVSGIGDATMITCYLCVQLPADTQIYLEFSPLNPNSSVHTLLESKITIRQLAQII